MHWLGMGYKQAVTFYNADAHANANASMLRNYHAVCVPAISYRSRVSRGIRKFVTWTSANAENRYLGSRSWLDEVDHHQQYHKLNLAKQKSKEHISIAIKISLRTDTVLGLHNTAIFGNIIGTVTNAYKTPRYDNRPEQSYQRAGQSSSRISALNLLNEACQVPRIWHVRLTNRALLR
jgi:hypothetical protein